MRELAIDSEKRYLLTHGLANKEGEELAKEEYGARTDGSSCFSDMRCQKAEGYGILETESRYKEKKV